MASPCVQSMGAEACPQNTLCSRKLCSAGRARCDLTYLLSTDLRHTAQSSWVSGNRPVQWRRAKRRRADKPEGCREFVYFVKNRESRAGYWIGHGAGYGYPSHAVQYSDFKGFYKSLINLARCRMWSQSGGQHYFMSAEDLTCQAGVAVQQDLALIALLGLTHVERNGHHYVKGMAGAGVDEQENFLAGHPGLYARRGKDVCTHITGGMLDLTSLQCTGFGTAVEPDWDNMSDMDTTKWIEGKDNG